jgi:Chalcone isomerase-like
LPGGEFYVALLKIFLGDRPVDQRLKAGLLGTASA